MFFFPRKIKKKNDIKKYEREKWWKNKAFFLFARKHPLF